MKAKMIEIKITALEAKVNNLITWRIFFFNSLGFNYKLTYCAYKQILYPRHIRVNIPVFSDNSIVALWYEAFPFF